MKIADAHMSKNQFQQAAKHFSKVLKRHQDHLPALLGYASAYERSSNSNQLEDVCIAYMQAAQVALIRGAYDLTDAVMQRALDVSLLIPNQKRLGILEKLFNYSHTDSIAADVSYEIGRVLSAQNYSLNDARYSFQLANALMEREAGNSSACHARSNLELGRISLENESDYASAIIFVEKALLAGLDEVRVQALVILGRSKAVSLITSRFYSYFSYTNNWTLVGWRFRSRRGCLFRSDRFTYYRIFSTSALSSWGSIEK
jgi:tetratricopeptide (TPR) repeat protein